MPAILCHMTSQPLVQSKDNEINRDIKFCPSIPQCLGDIALSNNFNLINPTFKKSVLNCTELFFCVVIAPSIQNISLSLSSQVFADLAQNA